MSSDASVAQSLRGTFRILGICWTVHGVIRLIMTICLVVFNGTATVMFGALLVRVPDPYALMRGFRIIYTATVVLSAVCGLLGFLAGLVLLAGRRPGRTLAVVAGFLSLSNLPLGVTLGIYTLLVSLPMGAAQLYGRFGQTP